MEIMSLRKFRIIILFGLALGILLSFAMTYIFVKKFGWGPGAVLMAVGSPILISIIMAISYHNGRVTWYGHPGRRIKIPFADILENKLYDARGVESPLKSKEADEDKD